MSNQLRVLALPDYRKDNPYQQLLAKALSGIGVETQFPAGYKRVLPIFRATLANKPDVLHLHWPTPYFRGKLGLLRTIYTLRTAFDLLLVKLIGVRLVWTVHNVISHDTPSPKLELAFSRWISGLADALIVHSKDAQNEIISEYNVDEKKVSVIKHGSFSSVYRPPIDSSVAREQSELPSAGPIALFFGMVRPYKGVHHLLEAWPKVLAQMPDAYLVIAGATGDTDYVERLHGLLEGVDRVRLDLRYVPDDEVHVLMSAANLLVLPFEKSLTSGSVTLANGFGLPIVTTSVAGGAKAENAIYADAESHQDLADAIVSAFKTLKRSRVEAVDDWPEIAAEHFSIYAPNIPDRTLSISKELDH